MTVTTLGRGGLRKLDALGEDARAELIDGVLYKLPMTTFAHGHIATAIVTAIGPAYQQGRGGPGGWWIQGENDFIADGKEVFRPDAIGWRKRRLPRPSVTGRVSVVPDWVCEVLSPTDRAHDLTRKRDAYARVGVRYRWYVDPESRVLQSFELRRGQWIELGAFCDRDHARTPPFDAVELRLAEWWLPRARRGR